MWQVDTVGSRHVENSNSWSVAWMMISSRQCYTTFLNHENFVFLTPPHVWWWELYLIHNRPPPPVWYKNLYLIFCKGSSDTVVSIGSISPHTQTMSRSTAVVKRGYCSVHRIYLSTHTDDVTVNSRCQERAPTSLQPTACALGQFF